MEEKKLDCVDHKVEKANGGDDGAAKAAGKAVGIHGGGEGKEIYSEK